MSNTTDTEEIVIKDEQEIINDVVETTKSTKVPNAPKLHNVNAETSFTEAIDKAKVNVVEEAAAHDQKFVEDFKKQLKEATLKSAELEREKQELEKQNVQYASELLETRQELNKFEQAANKWENRQKCREYHYKGVQPIMEFVGIKTPMNLLFLYLLTIILLPFYLIGKLFRGTVGALISGACDEDRPKAVKGALWTIVFIVVLSIVALGIVLALGWMGIINIPLFNK